MVATLQKANSGKQCCATGLCFTHGMQSLFHMGAACAKTTTECNAADAMVSSECVAHRRIILEVCCWNAQT